jgi:hypothetical protein
MFESTAGKVGCNLLSIRKPQSANEDRRHSQLKWRSLGNESSEPAAIWAIPKT